MREPIATGRYYERDNSLLQQAIAAHYNGQRGPGALPLSKIEHNVKAIIAPNSPYKNCGDCMAWAYKMVAESPLADVYIIMATNQGSQESGLTLNTFSTPLGICRTDQELAKTIVEKGTIAFNDDIHLREHPIEVQLPFLQHAKYQQVENIKILPILLSKGTDVKQLALDIKESLVELKRNPIFIVSSGFTHFGPLFHYVPFVEDVRKGVADLDREAIQFVIGQNPDGFRSFIGEKMLVTHGSLAIELLLRILRPCTVKLEQYYTSGDVLGDYKNTVSYAAITFEEKTTRDARMKEV
jgi:AmmeMemoRadiSam system protein B